MGAEIRRLIINREKYLKVFLFIVVYRGVCNNDLIDGILVANIRCALGIADARDGMEHGVGTVDVNKMRLVGLAHYDGVGDGGGGSNGFEMKYESVGHPTIAHGQIEGATLCESVEDNGVARGYG